MLIRLIQLIVAIIRKDEEEYNELIKEWDEQRKLEWIFIAVATCIVIFGFLRGQI